MVHVVIKVVQLGSSINRKVKQSSALTTNRAEAGTFTRAFHSCGWPRHDPQGVDELVQNLAHTLLIPTNSSDDFGSNHVQAPAALLPDQLNIGYAH